MKTKHTLMIVFHDMRLGGIQRKILDIIKYHQKFLPNTKIILCLRKREGIFLDCIPKDITVLAPSIHTHNFNITWFTLWLIQKLAIVRPDKILSFMDLGTVPTLVALQLLPWLKPRLTIGEDILTSKYVYTETFPSLRKLLIKWLYPLANTILVQTPIQKKDLEQMIYHGHSQKNIVASPNWLPLDYPPQKIIPQNKRLIDILFVGRIDAQKNLPLFLQIIKLVTKNVPKLKVKIVGDGDDRKKIIKLINKLSLQKNVEIIKPTLDTSKYYSNSKIFLLSSDYEGFPLTLMEAISSGCIPVLRNIPEISQFFTKDKSKIIYDTDIQAANIIQKDLKIPVTTYLQIYLDKILKNQQRHIRNYIKYF
ncbi:MAG TPA: glycosyltransferase [Candidatus Methanoperedens sp.]|nr:glycosyltransferase [Candidatus Methanoperedens sp.]